MQTSLQNFISLRRISDRFLRFLDSIKINTICPQKADSTPQFIKHRNAIGRQLARLTNFYFALAGVPIRYWSGARDWQNWEVKCFRMLNQDRYAARAIGDDTVCLDKIAGKSLWEYLTSGEMTREIVVAAARELRRAHQFWSHLYQGRWSHGDASASNFIFDEKTRRVRLIDFEIVHGASLSESQRHADDLLVFLLDLAGYISSRRWLPMSLAFLKGYDDSQVIAELRKRLFVPRGLARIWWNVRTNAKGAKHIGRRLDDLARAIDRAPEFRILHDFGARAGSGSFVVKCTPRFINLPRNDAAYSEGQFASATD
jgi:tRNA A-37 threonylcarbamoyl transferase component Bud32